MTDPFFLRDTGSLEQQIAARTKRRGSTVGYGQVTDIDALGNVTIDIGGNDRNVTRLLTAPVAVGDNVLWIRQGLDLIVVGPTASLAPPTVGTVAAVPANSYTVSVTTSIGAVDAWFPASYSPTVGDRVLLAWLGTHPVAVGAQGKTGTPPAPITPPRPPTPDPPPARRTYGRATFPATGNGTWRAGDGWRHDANGNVIQGTAPTFAGLNNGAWFYGGKIRSTLAGATVRAAAIWLGRVQGGDYGAQTVHLYRVTQNRRPAGNVTYVSPVVNIALDVGERGWYPLPTSFAQALIDSGGSVGIQAPTGPYVRLMGLSQSGRAGTIRIDWSR